jgi:hypothetical protein
MRGIPKNETRFQHNVEMLFSMVQGHIERENRDLFSKAEEVIPEIVCYSVDKQASLNYASGSSGLIGEQTPSNH